MPTITTVDATWDTGGTYDAAELRRADTTGFLGDGSANGVRGGVVRHGDTSLAVAVNGSDQVTVQPGAFVVSAATGLGCYRGSLAAATSAVALTARNATNPRIDLVVVQMTGTAAVVKTIDGTPAASPSAPALPPQHIELARLSVPAVAGGAVTVDSTWRSYATGLGGTLFVETFTRLPGSGNQKGQRATALDTGMDYRWSGAAWVLLNSPGGILGYAQTTSPQGAIGTTITDLTSLSVTVTVGASRRIRVSGYVPIQQSAAGGGIPEVQVREATTTLTRSFVTAAASGFAILQPQVVLTPSAGSHTYALAAMTSALTMGTNVAANTPAFVLVEDLGAV